MAQKNRKIHKKRGTRTCGYGNAQKHRGAGSRGGRGMAGSGKHKQIKMNILGIKFGKKGFKRHPVREKPRVINISEITKNLDLWLSLGVAQKDKKGYTLHLSKLGYEKLLGNGTLKDSLKIYIPSSSKTAKEKVKKAGGEIIEDGVHSV